MTTCWTIGHSTRPIDGFLAALASFQIETLADIRRFPASRRHPQFNVEELRKSLFHVGIRYAYLGDELGGLRDPKPGSRHVGLAGSSFQSYADWMEGPMFHGGVAQLAEAALRAPTAFMCAERNPKSCHRHLLSDQLTLVQGFEVIDILDAGMSRPHPLTPGARAEGERVLYERAGAESRIESFGADA